MILRMLQIVDYFYLASQDTSFNSIKIPPIQSFSSAVSLRGHGGLEPLSAGYILDIPS